MKNSWIFLVLGIFLILFSTVKADVIINSQDWRDVSLILLYAKLTGKKAHMITNLGEADLLLKRLEKSSTHELFESRNKPVIKNMKEFMRNYGFSMVVENVFNTYKDLQVELYSRVKDKVKGFVIIHPDFGTDLISVFPLAVNEKRWIFFVNKENLNDILSLISSVPEKSVIFYGKFLTQPWKDIPNPSEVIFGTEEDMNKEIVKRVWKKTRGWVVLANGKYIEEGFLSEGKPILLILENSPSEIAKFLKKLGVKLIEVIGPENVNFGYEIREASNKTIGVVAKIGITFTGEPELRGKIYTLPTKEVDYPVHNLVLRRVYFTNGCIIFEITNKGNVEEKFIIRALRIIGKKGETTFADENIHVIPPKETISFPVCGNYSEPEKVEAFILYGEKFKRKIRNLTTGSFYFFVKKISLPIPKPLEIKGVFYDPSLHMLWIKLKNNNKKPVWARAEVFGLKFLNESLTLSSPLIYLPSGESYLPFWIRLDGTQLKENTNLTAVVYYGFSKNLLSNTVKYIQRGEIKEKSAKNEVWIYILFVGALVIFLLLLLIGKKKETSLFSVFKSLKIRKAE